jgi:hypothetical protein
VRTHTIPVLIYLVARYSPGTLARIESINRVPRAASFGEPGGDAAPATVLVASLARIKLTKETTTPKSLLAESFVELYKVKDTRCGKHDIISGGGGGGGGSGGGVRCCKSNSCAN